MTADEWQPPESDDWRGTWLDDAVWNEYMRRQSLHWILASDHSLIECDLLTWARWFEDINNRRVAWWENDDWRVSTVFLGIDHGFGLHDRPILFETMVFARDSVPEGGDAWNRRDGAMWRYATWDEAEAGHRAVVEAILRGTLGDDEG